MQESRAHPLSPPLHHTTSDVWNTEPWKQLADGRAFGSPAWPLTRPTTIQAGQEKVDVKGWREQEGPWFPGPQTP